MDKKDTYHISIGLLVLSKGQGQVKKGHQMKILDDSRAIRVLLVTWDKECDDDIHF